MTEYSKVLKHQPIDGRWSICCLETSNGSVAMETGGFTVKSNSGEDKLQGLQDAINRINELVGEKSE